MKKNATKVDQKGTWTAGRAGTLKTGIRLRPLRHTPKAVGNIPLRYLPNRLSREDKMRQMAELTKSRKKYKKGEYYTRRKVASFRSRPSLHVRVAKKMYGVDKIGASRELAAKTGCSVAGLRKIMNKGRGAYYSSGSRPNQSAESWAVGRLASALTGQKAGVVDYGILVSSCRSDSRPLVLLREKWGKGGCGVCGGVEGE